jgi:agmatinase
MSSFDPSGVGISNGNIFGFPVTEKEADIILIPVPFDATASYGKGTSKGPEQILEASTQLDFFHPDFENAHDIKVFMLPSSKEALKMNNELVVEAVRYIDFLENGGNLAESNEFNEIVSTINDAQLAIKEQVKSKSKAYLDANKIVGVIGGEHSVPLGLLEALNDKYNEGFGVLQIDAHADLRTAYEGFKQSHASIFFNALECANLKKLVQVGIRDVAPVEIDLINNSKGRIKTYFDFEIKEELFKGNTWSAIVEQIVNDLPNNVYISFDIDALHPSLCPNTGTPVPGGFQLEEIRFLFKKLADSGKKIIGFDLCEVANGNNSDWDANVGARALWELIVSASKTI